MIRTLVLVRRATLTCLSLAMLSACSDRNQQIIAPEGGARRVIAPTDPYEPIVPPSDPSYSGAACTFTVTTPSDLRMTVSQRLHVFANAGGGCTTNDIQWTAEPSNVVTLTKKTTGVEILAKTATSKVTIKGTIGATSKGFEMQIVGARIEVSPATATIPVNGTQQLFFRAYDHTGWELGSLYPDRVWSITSSNSTVATINTSTGVVTGKAAGTAQITASLAGGTGTATITVVADPVASVTVSPNPASVSTGQTTQLTATLKSSNGTVLTGRTVTWTSANPSIATVSSSGLVTGVAEGSTTITATAESKSGSTTLNVSRTIFAPTTCNDCHTPWVPTTEEVVL